MTLALRLRKGKGSLIISSCDHSLFIDSLLDRYMIHHAGGIGVT